MTNLPRLYPGHQHQWADAENPGPEPERFTHTLVRCTICGLQMPRNVVEAFDTIRAEIADTRADLAQIQAARGSDPQPEQIPGEHYPHCNSECVGDMHMLLPGDQPGQDPA